MTDVTTIINAPVVVLVAGQEYKVRAIGFMHKIALTEADYRTRMVQQVKANAEAFSDPEMKREYILAGLDSIPSGSDLTKAAMSAPPSMALINKVVMAAVIDPVLTEDGVSSLMRDATQDEVRSLLSAVNGLDPKKKRASTRARQPRSSPS